jgi:ABC-type antimicrobial peptide transport system ATPase subunit
MRLPIPALGDWLNLRAIITGLLAETDIKGVGQDQVDTFHGWIKSSVEALRAGRQQQQQALAICGPPGCGKSLLQSIITDMLAGRACKAERYFSGKTPFNADLYTAEHLILEDEHCSTRIDQRMKLGAAIKQHTVSTNLTSLHPKGRTAVNLPGWWRISITLGRRQKKWSMLSERICYNQIRQK